MARTWFQRLPYALIALFFAHWILIGIYAVDIPFWDEWDNLGYLERFPGVSWFFGTHLEHRFFPTRLEKWVIARLFDGNLWLEQMLNFLLFGAVMLVLFRFLRRAAPRLSTAESSAFLLFLLSFHFGVNHISALHSVFHYLLLFLILGVQALFLSRRPLWGALALCLCAYSQAGGVLAAVAVVGWYILWCARDRRWKDALLAGVPVIAACLLWFVGHPRFGDHPKTPIGRVSQIADTFLNLVSFGFGIDTLSWSLGLFCLLLVVIPFILLWRRGARQPETWALVAFLSGVLVVLLAIALGRPTEWSKTARYAEYAAMVVPLSAAAWASVLEARWRMGVLLTLWLILFAGYMDKWNYTLYPETRRVREAGVACLKANFSAGTSILCPQIYPTALGERWEMVERAKPRFYRRLSEGTTPAVP